jgi:hypothetical protein
MSPVALIYMARYAYCNTVWDTDSLVKYGLNKISNDLRFEALTAVDTNNFNVCHPVVRATKLTGTIIAEQHNFKIFSRCLFIQVSHFTLFHTTCFGTPYVPSSGVPFVPLWI